MTHKLICTIPAEQALYEIEVQGGALYRQAKYLASLGARFAVIADEAVSALYGEKLLHSLAVAGLQVELFTFPSGEKQKTRATKESLENELLEKGYGRDSCVIALGGGVAMDLAGYVAATYCRGVPLVLLPTTLLGMVDASIGGKTGVNTAHGKNLLGCIYQPTKVVIDPTVLISLPRKELVSGLAEVIKHAVVADSALFSLLERHAEEILALDSNVVEKLIFTSCRIKQGIVEQDVKEKGRRRLLNFGHTVGHALEKVTAYALAHGEAVAIGMLVESYMAVELGVLGHECFVRLKNLLSRYGLLVQAPLPVPIQTVRDAMALDKKALQGRPRFVIINAVGSALDYDGSYCTILDEALIIKGLQWINDALRCH